MATKNWSIRVEEEMLETIKQLAEIDKRTISAEIVYLLEKGIEQRDVEMGYLASMNILASERGPNHLRPTDPRLPSSKQENQD